MILFTADWHLKLGQKNVPVSWALNRYYLFFQQIHELEKSCDLHIIGGDLFDRLPSMEELDLYYEFVIGVSIPTIIYDGNHEATKKTHTFFKHLKRVTESLNPLVQIQYKSSTHSVNGKSFSILPYCELHSKNSIKHLDQSLPVFTHVRGAIPPHVTPEIDLKLFKDFPIVFAGDLHSHTNTQENIVYPGSPMTTSFHRSKVTTGFILVNEENWQWSWHEFKLPQLIRKTINDPEDMVSTEVDHTIYELEGDLQDLSAIKNTELLDKKIVKRSTEATLFLNKDMTIEQELAEYLQYILSIPPEKIPQLIGIFRDNVTRIKVE